MKTGITRPVDGLGRVVIPAEIRRSMEIGPGDYLAVETTEDGVFFRKAIPECVFCGTRKEVYSLLDRPVCLACAQRLGIQGLCVRQIGR